MKHYALIAGGVLLAGSAMAQARVQTPVETSKSTVGILNLKQIQTDAQPRPVQSAPEGKHVQAMTIALTFKKGVVSDATVTASRRINSIAPKVFLRRSGDWIVTIEGEEERSFFVNNPGRREVEPAGDADKDYEWIEKTGTVEWPLIVPLYAGDTQLDAKSIVIRDARTKKVILKADLG